jgi:hypothetical protein
MLNLDRNVCFQKARETGFTPVGSATIAADGQDPAKLDELDCGAKFLDKRLAIVDAVPIVALA